MPTASCRPIRTDKRRTNSFHQVENAFSTRLLLQPFFQGFSRLDFLDIVEKTPFDFRTYRSREAIVRQGEESSSLCLLLSGSIECEAESPDHLCRITEVVKAPWAVQPECLFGLHNRYTRTVYAQAKTQIASIDKQSVRKLLADHSAFQINFYNALCTYAQNTSLELWAKREENVADRFRHFVQRRCLRPIGPKTVRIHMENLATELGVSRLRVSQMLAGFAAQGKLKYSRGVITIEALEKL